MTDWDKDLYMKHPIADQISECVDSLEELREALELFWQEYENYLLEMEDRQQQGYDLTE